MSSETTMQDEHFGNPSFKWVTPEQNTPETVNTADVMVTDHCPHDVSYICFKTDFSEMLLCTKCNRKWVTAKRRPYADLMPNADDEAAAREFHSIDDLTSVDYKQCVKAFAIYRFNLEKRFRESTVKMIRANYDAPHVVELAERIAEAIERGDHHAG